MTTVAAASVPQPWTGGELIFAGGTDWAQVQARHAMFLKLVLDLSPMNGPPEGRLTKYQVSRLTLPHQPHCSWERVEAKERKMRR